MVGILISGAVGYLSHPVLQSGASFFNLGRRVSVWSSPLHGAVYCVTSFVVDNLFLKVIGNYTTSASELKFLGGVVRMIASTYCAGSISAFVGFSAPWNLPVLAVASISILIARGKLINTFKNCCQICLDGELW